MTRLRLRVGLQTQVRPLTLASLAIALLLLSQAALGCAEKAWETQVVVGGRECSVTAATIERLRVGEANDPIPAERVLWSCGARVVDAVEIDGREREWRDLASTSTWHRDGTLALGEERLRPTSILVRGATLPGGQDLSSLPSLLDVAPTVAASLDLALPGNPDGAPLAAPKARRAVIVLLDGFGYLTYERAVARGDVPRLAALPPPRLATTVYPSITPASTASLITGLRPERHGVADRGIRSTKASTLFDGAASAGLSVVAIEGESLPLNLRSTDLRLSGDRNGDGYTDDEVLANALRALAEGSPDLLWVHFHGIDDASHTYGPDSPEAHERVRAVDANLGRLLDELPSDALVVVCADHGQHSVREDGRLGNHGTLQPEDTLIPLWVMGAEATRR